MIIMERQYIEHWFSNEGTRNDVRKIVLEVFMDEAPGTGAGELSSKYTYIMDIKVLIKMFHHIKILAQI